MDDLCFYENSLLSPSASVHNFILAKTWFIASCGICKNSGITWVSWDKGEVFRWTCVKLSLGFLLVNTGDWFVTMFGMSTSLYLSVNVTLADTTLWTAISCGNIMFSSSSFSQELSKLTSKPNLNINASKQVLYGMDHLYMDYFQVKIFTCDVN